MKNILVTIDFDKKEEILIEKAHELAKAFHAKLWMMHIAEPDPDFVGFHVGPKYIRESQAEKFKEQHIKIQEYATMAKELGIEAEGLLVQGATIEMIIKEAKELNTDLIMAGHRKHNIIYKAFIGSVSSEIIKKSQIPVLIVPLI